MTHSDPSRVHWPASTSSVELALLAVMAAHGGDHDTAGRHLARAQAPPRPTARRERQVVEIAALVVAGHGARAAGLALEHTAEFPADAELLARLAPTGEEDPGRTARPAGAVREA